MNPAAAIIAEARANRLSHKIAALYVQARGVYFGHAEIDPWDEARDARKYAGPWPVIAHPPCARWGRYWFGGPTWISRGNPPKNKGDDGGCFAAALAAVRQFGGVLEHPEASYAWAAFGLTAPPIAGGWIMADFQGGWTCCVAQGHYGHEAEKMTWLYVHGVPASLLPSLRWGRAPNKRRVDAGFHTTEQRRRAVKTGVVALLSARQRAATPILFRDALIEIARSVTP